MDYYGVMGGLGISPNTTGGLGYSLGPPKYVPPLPPIPRPSSREPEPNKEDPWIEFVPIPNSVLATEHNGALPDNISEALANCEALSPAVDAARELFQKDIIVNGGVMALAVGPVGIPVKELQDGRIALATEVVHDIDAMVSVTQSEFEALGQRLTQSYPPGWEVDLSGVEGHPYSCISVMDPRGNRIMSLYRTLNAKSVSEEAEDKALAERMSATLVNQHQVGIRVSKEPDGVVRSYVYDPKKAIVGNVGREMPRVLHEVQARTDFPDRVEVIYIDLDEDSRYYKVLKEMEAALEAGVPLEHNSDTYFAAQELFRALVYHTRSGTYRRPEDLVFVTETISRYIERFGLPVDYEKEEKYCRKATRAVGRFLAAPMHPEPIIPLLPLFGKAPGLAPLFNRYLYPITTMPVAEVLVPDIIGKKYGAAVNLNSDFYPFRPYDVLGISFIGQDTLATDSKEAFEAYQRILVFGELTSLLLAQEPPAEIQNSDQYLALLILSSYIADSLMSVSEDGEFYSPAALNRAFETSRWTGEGPVIGTPRNDRKIRVSEFPTFDTDLHPEKVVDLVAEARQGLDIVLGPNSPIRRSLSELSIEGDGEERFMMIPFETLVSLRGNNVVLKVLSTLMDREIEPVADLKPESVK